MQKKIKLAIFDIDGTIFRSSLVIQLINGLVAEGVFPRAARKEMESEYLAWLDRRGTYEVYIDKVVKIYVKYITGKSFKRVNGVARAVIAYHKDRVYRFTRDLIKKLKKGNYFLAAISGSPSYIVSAYAKTIGFNIFFGTELEVVHGKFTGKILSLDSALNKNKILNRLVKKYNVDLKHSLAVGDTESDIAMLKAVGRPIAFNPNERLAAYAQRKKWPVVVERKDVIYKVKNFDFVNFS